jgi:predicted Zn-dependent protease with MMP-like domain
MTREEFENAVGDAFQLLPARFKEAIENVAVIVEDYPDDETVAQMRLPSKYHLLGLYQGIPLPARGTWYGMSPTPPDRISLYQKNIESHCTNAQEIKQGILDVLVHEIGHYFGMSEDEIRRAGY